MLERLLSLPAILVGAGLIYVGYFEQDPIYLFFYMFLGSSLTLFGILLLLGRGISTKPAKKKKVELKNDEPTDAVEPLAKSQEFCPSCGSSILSAGKFCGSCGRPIIISPTPP